MSAGWDLKAILAALAEQRWTVTKTKSARHKCVPPDPDHDIVVVAETSSWSAQQNTIRDLRRSGFVWPWPPPRSETPPKEAEKVIGGGHVLDQPPPAPTPAESTEQRLERLWRELREAKGYLELVDEQLDELGAEVDEAARAYHEAMLERRSAAERLTAAKAAFDQTFDAR
jgi:hypothetical protein